MQEERCIRKSSHFHAGSAKGNMVEVTSPGKRVVYFIVDVSSHHQWLKDRSKLLAGQEQALDVCLIELFGNKVDNLNWNGCDAGFRALNF